MNASDQFSTLLRAGTIGAVATCALCTPLDVARRSAQVALAPRRPVPGFTDALRAASQAGVAQGLFRGLPPALAHATVSPALFLVLYEWQKTEHQALEAALIARGVTTVLSQPFEFFRSLRQSAALLTFDKATHLERGAWDLICQDGLRSLWRGGVATLLRDVGFCGLLWTSYIGARTALCDEDLPVSAVQSAGIASVCAAVASAATQPFDVIKTRMQANNMTTSDKEGFKRVKIARFSATAAEIHKAAGLRGFWVGGLPRALSAVGGGLLLGPLYEFCQVVADGHARPFRRAFVLPPDTTNRMVHPYKQRSMYVEVKGG